MQRHRPADGKDKLRVLLVGEELHGGRGGIATVMRLILEHPYLQDKGVRFLTVFPALPAGSMWQKTARWLSGIVKFLFVARSVDLIHLHHTVGRNLFLSGFLVMLGKAYQRKVILHNHAADFREFYQGQSRAGRAIVRHIFMKADANIVLSQSWLNWYQSIAPAARWIRLYNVSEIIPDRSMLNSVDRHHPSILFLGRLEKRKGIYDLLDVIPKVLDEIPNAEFILAGDGDVAEIQNAVRARDLSARVSVPGYLDASQKAEVFGRAGIYVLPSYNEGLPMALLEVMAVGIVPIVTAVGGIPEVVVNGVNGILISPGDRQRLLEAIVYLYSEHKTRKELACKARQTIEESFSPEQYGRRLFEIYQAVLKSHHANNEMRGSGNEL